MHVSLISTERVIPYARNPRKNNAAVSKVAASLREYGFRQPIVVDKDMMIIAGYESELAPSLEAGGGGNNRPAVMQHMAVRRLTPRECERLQGFTDDYTLVPYRGKPAADGPRYKALGNSMAVPVMRWLGKRI